MRRRPSRPRARTGRTVVFVEGHGERVTHRSHAIDYVPTRLDDQHVRASAAIPILFPPVRVEQPREARGWYFDGGTRLNTPIKPALDLGAERLIVVATDSVAEPIERPGRHEAEPPDFGDGALHVLQGMLVDPVVEDMRILGNINMFFAERNGAMGASATAKARGGRALDAAARTLPRGARQAALPVHPLHLHRAGAARRDRAPGVERVPRPLRRRSKGLRSPDFPLLNRLLGGESPTHGELLSYLFFDHGVHRGADPDGSATTPAAGCGPTPAPKAMADRAPRRVHEPKSRSAKARKVATRA